jgi:hypothetical protein
MAVQFGEAQVGERDQPRHHQSAQVGAWLVPRSCPGYRNIVEDALG